MRQNDNEIMKCLQDAAKKCGLRLTYTNELFFLRLLEFAQAQGENCPEGIKVVLSINEMSERLSISKRMVISSLRNLIRCGAIIRRREKNTFPQSKSATILKKQFYERSEVK